MRYLLILFFIVPRLAAAGSEDPRWQVNLSSYVSEGDYDTGVATHFLYSSFSLRRLSSRGDVTLIVPYIDVTSDETVLVVRGVPQPPLRAVPTPRDIDSRRTATPVPSPPPIGQQQTTRERGFGDLAIVGRWFLFDERGAWPSIDVEGRFELPTGDETHGLGLGRSTSELGIQLSKTLGDSFVGIGDASYTWVREPEGIDLQNGWEYSIGLGCYPVRRVLVSVSFEEWRPITPGAVNGRAILGSATLKLGPALKLYASSQFKLSGSAPDFTAGGGLGVRF